MLTNIHHAAIIASDYTVSKDFYTRILQLTVVKETFRETRNSYKLDLALDDGSQIELFSFPSSPPRVTNPEACGLRHLAFGSPDIEKDWVYLMKQGVKVEQIRLDDTTGKRFFFFADPDGLPLEIYEL